MDVPGLLLFLQVTGNTPGRIVQQYGSPAANKVVLIQLKSQAAGCSPVERDCNAAVYVRKRLKSVSFTAAVSFLHLVTRPDRRYITSQILRRPSCKKKKKKNLRQLKMSSVECCISQSESVLLQKQGNFTDQNKPATCSTSTGGSGVSSKQTRISRI